ANVTVQVNQANGQVTLTPANGFHGTIKLMAGVSGVGSPTHQTDFDTQAFSLVVNPSIVVTPTTLPVGLDGTAYNQLITASQGTGAITFTVSNVVNPIAGINLTPNPNG